MPVYQNIVFGDGQTENYHWGKIEVLQQRIDQEEQWLENTTGQQQLTVFL